MHSMNTQHFFLKKIEEEEENKRKFCATVLQIASLCWRRIFRIVCAHFVFMNFSNLVPAHLIEWCEDLCLHCVQWNYPFIMVKHDKRMAFTFFAKTEDQRQKWVEAIALALWVGSSFFFLQIECTLLGWLLAWDLAWFGFMCQLFAGRFIWLINRLTIHGWWVIG